jgi:hypothetical protein
MLLVAAETEYNVWWGKENETIWFRILEREEEEQ